ncbi:histidine phosphatase family protein [Streptomyces sp. NPDC048290]|uniref:histidine phosphatase family protein n=1 Tax=Streptomyces sp. NPDC048290 TaxID=3155811 RepID=UPI0034330763
MTSPVLRLRLITPATGPALREARFYDGRSGLDDSARTRAETGPRPPDGPAVRSPGARCRETVTALGLSGAGEEPALAGLDSGRWRGLTLAEVTATEPEAVARWLADPGAAPHGGEPVEHLCLRIGAWLDTLAASGARELTAVVEPDVVRAVVVRALGAPASAFWRVDAPPLTLTELTGRPHRWNLRTGRPLG